MSSVHQDQETRTPTFWEAPHLAKAGYPVFPVKNKVATVAGGLYACTTDISQIAAWIEAGKGDHDIGIATGLVSGVVVIDADNEETCEWMEKRYGTPHVRTRRGGHWYFRHPKDGKVWSNKVRDGLDRKGEGGLAEAPPSGIKTWTNGIPVISELPVLPEEFKTRKAETTSEERKLSNETCDKASEIIARHVSRLGQGSRHEHLMHMCGVLLSHNISFADSQYTLVKAWSRVGGELADRAAREVENTLRTTQQQLAEGEATGVPSMEKLTPSLFDELRDFLRVPKIKRQRRDGFHKADSSDSSDSFSKVDNLIQTPDFPVDALPAGCAQYVREASASLACDPALVGVPVIGALSGVIGYSREIRIKPGWTESATLYLGVVDEPGSRKSPAASLAYKPLEKLQATLRKAYKEEKKSYEEQMRRHAVAKKQAAKEGEPEPEPPAAPVMRRCIVDDITIEALAARLEQNPRGFLSHQDELTGFLRGMDQYKSGGKGNTRQSYLKMWSNRPIYVDRKGSDEPVVVPRPALTLQGGIQPSVLHEIADGRDDGFLDRFDFAYPEPGRGGYSEETISYAAQSAYEDVIGSLWDRGPHQEDERSGELVPDVVRMEPEAKALFVSEANNLSAEMATAGFPKVLRGPWSKFDTKLARLALIIALARCAEEQSEIERVTAEDMKAALRLLFYFKATTRKVYGQLFEANPDDILAADIKTFLTKNEYVFIGSTSELMDVLESEALPDSPESLGRALRRIVKATPELSLESKPTGDKRVITLRLEKLSELSEPSEPSDEDDDEVEVGL